MWLNKEWEKNGEKSFQMNNKKKVINRIVYKLTYTINLIWLFWDNTEKKNTGREGDEMKIFQLFDWYIAGLHITGEWVYQRHTSRYKRQEVEYRIELTHLL